MTHFKTVGGRQAWLTRSMLRSRVDVSQVRPRPPADEIPVLTQKALADNTYQSLAEQLVLAPFHKDIVEGDEVWKYSNLGPLSGSIGYVLIRGDVVVNVAVVMRS